MKKINSIKINVPVFEKLALEEKKVLGRIYHLAKNPESYKSSDRFLLNPLELIKITILLNKRSFNQLKPFYLFLVENELAGMIINIELNRDLMETFPYPERFITIDYE